MGFIKQLLSQDTTITIVIIICHCDSVRAENCSIPVMIHSRDKPKINDFPRSGHFCISNPIHEVFHIFGFLSTKL